MWNTTRAALGSALLLTSCTDPPPQMLALRAAADERPALCADLTGDGTVNAEDLGAMRAQFLSDCVAEVDRINLDCGAFSWDFIDAAAVPGYVTRWPYRDDYLSGWITQGLWPDPRPNDWQQPEATNVLPCALRIGDRFIPVLVFTDSQ